MNKFETNNNEYIWVDGSLWVSDSEGDTHLKNAAGRWTCLGDCEEHEAEKLARDLEILGNN